ncbi:RNA polymerase sigma factor [Clostridium gasigenes]|uniref:RNA polymerase sigma factor n=1 Tax=Clostridium gasigenes TaxID=94869 RepID=UPI001C0C96E9|nr:RNA polymerase sigma factor [Clostridium gasigenes]MBU3131309.1 RNA polymerase sigma factor [Clostridium gasigenes]
MIGEKKLIKLVVKGDKSAASELINLYYKMIFTYVFNQTRDSELSKDLTQEIFISMLKSITNYEGKKSSFKNWVYKIASNKIVDYYRSKYYKYTTIVEEIENYDLKSSHNVEYEIEIKEDTEEIMNVVNRLTGNMQEIFRLKVFGEMTFSEISILLDISESTVKTRYYSSVRKIKKLLEEGDYEK